MANRKNTFLLKRSNVAGNIPSAGQILLGELALNTADVILYASGTTTNSILPIGWDRVHRTGDTMTGPLIINGNLTVTGNTILNTLTATTVSATTFYGDGSNLTGIVSGPDVYVTGGTYNNPTGTATFTNNTGGTFSVTGFTTGGTGTDTYVTGVTISNGVLTVSQNQGQPNLTASTNVTRTLTFNSNDMSLNTAARATLTPLVMAVTRFAGTGAIDDAGLSFSIPNDYVGSPEFNFVWRAASTSANNAKIFLDVYTGSTNNLGSLTTSVETLSIITTPTNANTFIISSGATSNLVLAGGDTVHVRIYRDPSDGGDTFTDVLDMINLNFKYNSIS